MSFPDAYFRHRSSVLLLLTWPILAWTLGPRSPSAAAQWLAIALVASGVALRLAAARCIGRSARVHRAGASAGLQATGPYALTRNPLYLSAAIVLAGLALYAGASWQAAPMFGAAILAYTPVVLHEEAVLRHATGEPFAAYTRAVPRWIGVPRTAPSRRVDAVPWREVLRREPLLIPGVAVALGAIALVRSGMLPLGAIFDAVERVLPVTRQALCAAGLLLGAALNSLTIERKRLRRRSARAASAAIGPVAGPIRE